jgi:glycine hydroxymethyltransferase
VDSYNCKTNLKKADPQVAGIIEAEESRIENTLDLIASENYPPRSIMEADGSIFGIKAAEGYPGNRFHAGCRCADELETLAISRAKQLFNAEHANVQPHSGVSANLAVYFSVLEVGDRILAMKLAHGGHLSHGDSASITGKCFRFAHYSVNPQTELIDYDEVAELASNFKPKMIIAGASSYPRLIDYPRMSQIARDNSAFFMVDMAHIAGLVAAKVIPSPVPLSDFVTFTTYKTLAGGRGGVILCRREHAKRVDRTIFPGAQGTPALNAVAAKAVCFKLAMQPQFVELQRKIVANASVAAEAFRKRGCRIVAGGTDTHMILLDLRSKGITGKAAEEALESVGINVNRNVIPYDPQKSAIASGLRLGFSSITMRKMGNVEVVKIVELIDTVLTNLNGNDVLNRVAAQVAELCRTFPAYTTAATVI